MKLMDWKELKGLFVVVIIGETTLITNYTLFLETFLDLFELNVLHGLLWSQAEL